MRTKEEVDDLLKPLKEDLYYPSNESTNQPDLVKPPRPKKAGKSEQDGIQFRQGRDRQGSPT